MQEQQDREGSFLNSFITPFNNKPAERSTYNSRRRSVHKRIPIFSSHNHNRSIHIFQDSSLPDFNLPERQQIGYDFCGCEKQMTPCDVIADNFLRTVKGDILRLSYEKEADRRTTVQNMRESRYKKSLLGQLPKWYPEILYSHLKNLMQVVGVDKINLPEFLCLAGIQYHSKVEYLTYYLYQDLKKSYCEKEKFRRDTERELAKLGTNLNQIKITYSESIGLSDQFVQFLNDYYDSVGAMLVPIQSYAKFLVAIYKHGNFVLVKMLTNFLVLRKDEMKRALKFLRLNEMEVYRNFMRELNFQDFIEQAK